MGPYLPSFSTACTGCWRISQTVSGSSTGHSSSSPVMVWDPLQLVGMCSPHSTSCASSHHNLFCPLLPWPCPCQLEAQGYLYHLQASQGFQFLWWDVSGWKLRTVNCTDDFHASLGCHVVNHTRSIDCSIRSDEVSCWNTSWYCDGILSVRSNCEPCNGVLAPMAEGQHSTTTTTTIDQDHHSTIYQSLQLA